ncbi:MAG: hydantoinase/oxoprolinase family protein, partial [Candidatus Bathyarchaeia archaeon]
MIQVFGLDIGGANIKSALLKAEGGLIETLETAVEYFPIWRRGKEQLPVVLEEIRKGAIDQIEVDGVGVTMTAELSDAYRTKREGVGHILDCVAQVFADARLFVLDVEANLRSIEDARREPIRVAAANWAATGWMISKEIRDCIIIDIGSTTTSIIPVASGRIAAAGRTDLEKLLNGELVYTGSLRTNVAAIVNSIPIRDGSARVSSEL